VCRAAGALAAWDCGIGVVGAIGAGMYHAGKLTRLVRETDIEVGGAGLLDERARGLIKPVRWLRA